MEDNIEVKDVQKTEYLDKNGLDMLWTKIKENTHNQVEVERNRAVAKEDNITNSLSEFASKTTADAQYFRAGVHSYDIIGTFSKKHSLGTAWLSDYDGDPRLIIRNPERMNNKTILTASNLFMTDYYGSQIIISPDGVKMPQKTTKDIVTANNSTAHIGLDDDQTEYTYVAPLEEGKVPAKYLDLPQIDTTAIKTLEDKITANATAIEGKQNAGNYLHYETLNDEGYYEIPNVCINDSDYNLHRVTLNPEAIQITTGDLEENDTTGIAIASNGRNPYIALTDSAYTNTLKITRDGISNADNNANHVYATDGSIADLTQYAKKSEITAGSNVNDVQVNGVSVVENKIANIKPATKESLGVVKVGDGLNVTDGTISVDTTAIGTGNYIPYESIENNMYATKSNEGILFKSSSGDISIHQNCINVKNEDNKISILSDQIWLQEITNDGQTETIQFRLDRDGLYLYGGDNHSVLTSGGSTIDITQYAKRSEIPTVPTKVSQLQNDSEFIAKSVYDEKIAALEARIAALEAKHVEV